MKECDQAMLVTVDLCSGLWVVRNLHSIRHVLQIGHGFSTAALYSLFEFAVNAMASTTVCPTAVAADWFCGLLFRRILPNNRSNSSTTSLQYPDGPSRTETLVITVAIAEIMN